jgi:Flp pilus assembly protein TadB
VKKLSVVQVWWVVVLVVAAGCLAGVLGSRPIAVGLFVIALALMSIAWNMWFRQRRRRP